MIHICKRKVILLEKRKRLGHPRQAQDEPLERRSLPFRGLPEMWRRLPRDDRHKAVPLRRRFPFWKETAYDPESLGAAIRQACDLEGVGVGARQFSKLKNFLV